MSRRARFVCLWVVLMVAGLVPARGEDSPDNVLLEFRQGRDGYTGCEAARLGTGWPGQHDLNKPMALGYEGEVDHAHSFLLLRFTQLYEPLMRKVREGYRVKRATLSVHLARDPAQPNIAKRLSVYGIRREWGYGGEDAVSWNYVRTPTERWHDPGGAQAESDLFVPALDEQPLHTAAPTARFNVTDAFLGAAYGPSLGYRISRLERTGFRFAMTAWPGGRSDWGPQVATPAHPDEELRPMLSLELAPCPEVRHKWELIDLDNGWLANFEIGTPAALATANHRITSLGPKQWPAGVGWCTIDFPIVWYRYRSLLTDASKDRLHAWLSTQLAAGSPSPFEPGVFDHSASWWRSRATWIERGRPLWNHPAMGLATSLLGGQIIGDQRVSREGQYWLWRFLEQSCDMGSICEYLNTYYCGMTLSYLSAAAAYAEDPKTALAGRILEEKIWLDYLERFDPLTKQMVSPYSRATTETVLGMHTGSKFLLHAFSEKGAFLYDKESYKEHGITWASAPGVYSPPADRTPVQGIYRPGYLRAIMEHKPRPYYVRSSFRPWGSMVEPGWLKTYLGQRYGIASASSVAVPPQQNYYLLGYWAGEEQVQGLNELGILYARYVNNERLPLQKNTYYRNGQPSEDAKNFWCDGVYRGLQDRNRIIALFSPRDDDNGHFTAMKAAIFVFRPGGLKGGIYLGKKKIERTPATSRFGKPIFIRDDDVYVAVIPLAASDLGRRDEVVVDFANKHWIISAYNFQSKKGAKPAEFTPEELARTRAGFVLEFGEKAEWGSFAAFRKHIESARVEQDWNGRRWRVQYESGGRAMEMEFVPHNRVEAETPKLVSALIDGQEESFLVMRQSPCVVQGRTAELICGGATLRKWSHVPFALIAEPTGRTFVVVNPTESSAPVALETPQGSLKLTYMGLGRVVWTPGEGLVTVQTYSPIGTLTLPGERDWKVLLNGQDVSSGLTAREGEEEGEKQKVWQIDLGRHLSNPTVLPWLDD